MARRPHPAGAPRSGGGAPVSSGLGIVEGFERVGDHTGNDERLLPWAPGFADEAADSVVQALTDVGIELTDAGARVAIARS